MPPRSCQRCKQTTNGPQAFLLTCKGCNKTWHHRCLMPPIEDAQLLDWIRATTTGDTANSIDAWKCRRCKKNRDSATEVTPSVASSIEPEKSVRGLSNAATQAVSVPAKSEEEDRMEVDLSPQAPSRVTIPSSITLQPVKIPSPPPPPPPPLSPPPVNQVIRPQPVEPPPVAIQPQVNQNVANEANDDDSDDLYGPPIERRVIRILPSLAEELREQQRARRELLAPDWILERHANDPSWTKRSTSDVGRRKARKPHARKIGENGINVDQLMGYFTKQDWLKKHAV